MTFHRMTRIRRVALTIVALALSGGAAHAADRARDLALLDALRAGGLIIYFRHAATDWSQADDVRAFGDWRSCDPQRMRQLSAGGRAASRSVGAAMRTLRIPVHNVLASPYCRTLETARLMDLGPVSASDAVINMRVAERFGGREAVAATASRLLASEPPRGSNTVIVAHGNVALATLGFRPAEGEAVLVRPGGGAYAVIGRLTPAAFARLERHARAGR